MSIELLRHGDTGQRSYRGQLDDPLSELGWRQLREATRERRWDAIVASPLRRCAEFARALSETTHAPLRMDARLMEYHFGAWQGVPIEVLAEEQGDALGRFWADPVTHAPPGGETFQAFRRRLTTAIDDMARAHGEARVLVVTHGGVIRLLRCVAEGRDFGDMAGIDVPHASLHRLTWGVA